MKSVIEIMLSTFQECKEAGSYFLFYLLALGLGLAVFWDRYGKTEVKDNWMVEEAKKKIQLWPFLYGVSALVLVAANPLAMLGMHKISPLWKQYDKIWSLLLVLFLSAYGMVCFLSILHEKKQKIILIFGIIILIGLAGSGYGLMSEREKISANLEESEIAEFIKEQDENALVLAPEAILEYIGNYEPEIRVLYGKDLYTPNLDMGIMDTYSEEIMQVYEAMKQPAETLEEIADMAFLYDCDILIVKKFENPPFMAGRYQRKEITQNYIVYAADVST